MRSRLTLWLAVVLGALAVAAVGAAHAAEAPQASLAWSALSASQKQALAPLQSDWSRIDAQRKEKWLEVANRFASMPAAEKTRVTERMAEWARMSPSQRTRARLQFQEARQVPLDERRARWEAYQNLPAEERRSLAMRAKRDVPPATTSTAGVAPARAAKPPAPTVAGRRGVLQGAVPTSPAAAPPNVLRQARPGATTTPLSTRATPPLHHQAGLPKIAATPGFVDPATLLPKRGPQGAAARPVATREPARQP